MSFATTLRQRVTVYKPQDGADSVGQPLAGWVEYGKRWADVRVTGGLETLRNGRDTSLVDASIRMRFCTDIDASMRIIYGGVTYNIKSVRPDGNRNYVDFVCESVK